MKIINDIYEIKKIVKEIKLKEQIISFVPTMGTLHEGHLSLIKAAKNNGKITIVSIFLNPTQFGDKKDFEKYPKNMENDIKLLEELKIDYLFLPSTEMMYPKNFETYISVAHLSKSLCGATRPGHFEGVLTVVSKLFNIVQPDIAIFGEKDFQQLQIIKRLVKDLNYSIEIKSMPIIREEDGLAMSSRNLRLSKTGRSKASQINKELKNCIFLYSKGEKNSKVILEKASSRFKELGIELDYLEIRDENLNLVETVDEKSRIFIAAFVENIRLIDNMGFKI